MNPETVNKQLNKATEEAALTAICFLRKFVV